MQTHVEAYTVGGILAGLVECPGHLRDLLERESELLVQAATFAPLDGTRPDPPAERPLAVDDLVLVVPEEDLPEPVHAAWHGIRLEAGPYVIEGELATMPGFDPQRALARPTGSFVQLRDVRVGLIGQPDAGTDVHRRALVNRYNVDRVDADLMLGFFFPGARFEQGLALALATYDDADGRHGG